MDAYHIVWITLGAGVAAAVGAVLWFRGPEDPPLTAILRTMNRFLMALWHDLRVYGPDGRRTRETLPREGAFIVVANHRSGLDPLLLAATSRRWIWFLMAREYWEAHPIFEKVGCIPVNRDGSDLSATRRALKALKDGRVIGLFPEGGIRGEDDSLAVGKSGVALLAARAGVPVVPFYIHDSPIHESVFKVLFVRSKTRVYRGEPLHFEFEGAKPGRAELEAFTNRLFEAISDLRERFRKGLDGSPKDGEPREGAVA